MRRRLTQLTVGRAFALAVAALGTVAVVFALLGGFALSRLYETRDRLIDGVEQARVATYALEVALLDEQNGVRGFVLSGQDAFLVPYRKGREAERVHRARLTEAVGRLDGDTSTAALTALLRTVDEWRTTFAEPAIAATRSGAPAAGATRAAAAGTARFGAIRRDLAALDRTFEQVRRSARAEVNANARTVDRVVFGFSAFLVLAGIAAALALRRFVTRPLENLAQDARAVADGSFDRPVRAQGLHDTRALAQDVESMRVRIVSALGDAERANAELAERQTQLERSNTELEQFAYVASHDLQEPLRKIASFSQLLQRRYGGQLDEKADQYLEFSADGARRMQDLINDLLAFSRVGRMSSGLELVSLDEALDEALGALETRLEETGARVERSPLPVVRGERRLLALVLQNLVGNAVKFTRDDVPPVVRISLREDGDDYEISVTDNGIGIDAEYADRVFVIFQRLHTRERYDGTGIGLALCRKIIEHHGGRIWLDTAAEGAGTVFRFTLPIPTEENHLP